MAYFQPERNSPRTTESAALQPDAWPTNRRIKRHKTAAKLHQGLKRFAIRFNNRQGICPRVKPLLEITRLFTFKGVPLIG